MELSKKEALEIDKGIWVIGDIHGCYNELKELSTYINKNCEVVCVGDLIDRGNYSKEVIDFIIKNNYKSVLGNHEIMAYSYYDLWLLHGGIETLESFKNEKNLNFYKNFFINLPLYLYYEFSEERPLLITHSFALTLWKGKDFPYSYAYFNDILWKHSNNLFEKKELKYETVDNVFNIFGHTPIKIPFITQDFANIDTGCVYKNKLSAIHYPTLNTISIKNID